MGCIFQMGWTWGGRGGQRGGHGHPVIHPVHPGHPIGDIYNTNSPKEYMLTTEDWSKFTSQYSGPSFGLFLEREMDSLRQRALRLYLLKRLREA